MAKILIAEDDQDISDQLTMLLKAERHVVEACADGDSASEFLKTYEFDLLILDWQLPGKSGVEIAAEYRKRGGSARILMLTGKAALDDKLQGFGAGADDYLTKPFFAQELAARIKALLSRPTERSSTKITSKSVELDTEKYTCLCNGKSIDLSKREFMLMEFFLRNPGQPFGQNALLDRLWASESDASLAAVRTCVKLLRRKLETVGAGELIKTVHGIGYKFDDQ